MESVLSNESKSYADDYDDDDDAEDKNVMLKRESV